MNKVFAIAGAIALSIIPIPTFSGEVEQQEMSSVTKLLLPQIGEKFKNLDIKEKKDYKQYLIEYLENVQKTGATGVSEAFMDRCDCDMGLLIEYLEYKNIDFRYSELMNWWCT